jgi:hypothetical protein
MSHRLTFFMLVLLPVSAFAQDQPARSSWWFGGAIGVNENSYSGEEPQPPPPAPFVSAMPEYTKGSGSGPYLALLLEYNPDPIWSGMLQLGFDSRKGVWNTYNAITNYYAMTTTMNYLSVEPSLRLTVAGSPLYFYAGPTLDFNVAKSYSYALTAESQATGNVGDARSVVIGGQAGAGFDFSFSDPMAHIRTRIGPFISVNFGQALTSIDSWNLTTIRAGVMLKFGAAWKPRRDADVDDKPLPSASTFVCSIPLARDTSHGSTGAFAQPVCSPGVDHLQLRV